MIELDYSGAVYPALRLKLGAGLVVTEDANGLATLAVGGSPDIGGASTVGEKLAVRAGTADHAYLRFYPRTAAPTTAHGYLGFGAAAATAFAFYGYASGVSAWEFWIGDALVAGVTTDGLRFANGKNIYAYNNTSTAYTLRLEFTDVYAVLRGGHGTSTCRLYIGSNSDTSIYLDAATNVYLRDLSSNNRVIFTLGTTPAVQLNGTQILTTRKTGWTIPTGTLSRAAFDESTVTLAQLAQRVAALITDLMSHHGLIGT